MAIAKRFGSGYHWTRLRKAVLLLAAILSMLVVITLQPTADNLTSFTRPTTLIPKLHRFADRSCNDPASINPYWHYLQPDLVQGQPTTWTPDYISARQKAMKRFLNSIPHYNTSFSPAGPDSRGIVTTVSDAAVRTVLTSLRILRRHGCFLPVEVFHFNAELSDENRNKLSQLHNVAVRSIEDENLLRGAKPKEGALSNYHIKAAAIVSASFENVLFLDGDNYAVRDPTYLFDTPEYLGKGAIFWPDFWKTHTQSRIWEIMQVPCTNEWEMESGQMVISRSRAWNAVNLAWYMNDPASDFFWKMLWYDKDTFRFAWKATKTPYHFIERWTAPAGFGGEQTGMWMFNRWCGHTMAQADPEGKWLFFHGNGLKAVDPRRLREGLGGKGPYVYIRVPNVPVGTEWKSPLLVRSYENFETAGSRLVCMTFETGWGEPDTRYEDVEELFPEFNEILLQEYEGAE
ncbi:hypothetical protein HK104_000020 [Borealophlyctis nickersoniae]|nr:hypothetical protein HK104_000020 [Borealophlyctis nickersoniae]